MSHRRVAVSVVLLFAFLVGCRTSGDVEAFRLPGTTKLPATPSFPTPKLTPGGHSPSVRGVEQTSMSSPALAQPQISSQPDASVAQVGFFDRLRPGCGPVECVAPTDCQPCQPQTALMQFRPTIDPQEFLCNGGDAPDEALLRKDGYIA
ncbi:MAG: hypothetical protein AAFU85_30420, partial [Planctomycetota bacterium]